MPTPLHVLILEDREADAELMLYELVKAGFEPTWQRVDEESAYLAHLDTTLDVILADYTLPQFDALQALRLLKERGLEIPFIVVAGTIGEEQAVACMKQGAADYLFKDRLGRLGPAVANALKERQLRAENQEAEKQLRFQANLLDAVDQAVMATDPTGKILYWNRFAETMYGWKAAEVLGRNVIDVTPTPASRQEAEEIMERLRRGESWSGEFLVQRRDGTAFPAMVIDSPVLDDRGEVIGIIGVSTDKSLQKRAEAQALAFSRLGQRLSAVQDAEEAARIIVSVADELLGWDACSLDLYSPERAEITPVINMDTIDGQRKHVPLAYKGTPGPMARRVIEAGGQLILRPAPAAFSSDLKPFGDTNRPSASLMFVPIRYGQQVSGILSIQSYTLQAYDEADLDTLQALADFCGGALDRLRVGEALRESEERFRLAVDNYPGMFVSYDADLRFQFVNAQTIALAGYTEEEFLGRTNEELFPPEVTEAYMPALRKAAATGATQTVEYTVSFHSRTFTFVVTYVPLLDEEGEIQQILGTAYDITERKKRARELETISAVSAALRTAATRQEMLPVLLDQQFDLLNVDATALVVCDPATGETVFELARGEWAQITGLRLPAGEGIIGHAIATGETYLNNDVRRDPRLVRPDLLGDIRAMAVVPLIAHGQIIGALSIGHKSDIGVEMVRLLTAIADMAANAIHRSTLHEQTQTQARQLQQIMDTVSEGLLLLDPEWRILLANPAAIGYLAFLAEVSVGERLTHLGEKPVEMLVTLPPAGFLAHEVIIEKPQRRIFEVFARPIASGAVTEGWVFILSDVTQQRQIRERIEQQERLAAVGQLASGIAHDFNNIMSIIVLYTQITQRAAGLSEKDHQRLNIIFQQATHAANLIHQILDFSRRSVMERSPLDLLPFLKEFVKLLRRTLPENITLALSTDEEECIVNADPTRLQQVLMNLAVNARDAMPEGGQLTLSLAQLRLQSPQAAPLPEMTAGHWVQLSMSDSGAGISPQILTRIFEPFFTTKAPGHGTGLGLSQVYGIVKQHEGHITVDSLVGKGTTFTIYLPLLMVADLVSPMSQIPSANTAEGETILVVEDNPATLVALQEILETLGYRVLAAADGQAALELFTRRGQEVDLVLCDMVMPKMGGMQLYRALKAQQPGVKMIIMTGYPLQDEGKDLLEQGVVAWLHKPFSAEEIDRKLQVALGKTR